MTFALFLAIKVLLLFGAAWIACWLLRGCSAAIRHQVWAAAILCSLALPLIEPATPKWRVSGFAALGTMQRDPPLAAAPAAIRVMATRAGPWSPRPMVLWIWGLGAIAMLARLLTALVQLSRASSRVRRAATDPAFGKLTGIAASLRAPVSLRLIASDSPRAMPLAWGLFRPKILLPSNAAEWPEDRLRLVLLHELAHVARRDWLFRICGELACALYWFHPLAWLAVRSLREESERAADDRVLGSGVPPADYADQLIALARTLVPPPRPWSAALAMARPSNFERRLTAMLNPSIDRRPTSARARVLTVAVALCLLLSLASVRTRAQGQAASYSGTVFDPSGAVVPGASVLLVNDRVDLAIKETSVTDPVGKFLFTNLPPGQYIVTVVAQGFQPNLMSITLDAGQGAARNVTLDLPRARFVARVSAPGTPRAPQSAAPTPIRVGGMVQFMKLIQKVTPEYPPVAQAAGIEGTVDLQAVIGKDGSVLNVHALSGPDHDLVQAAIDAVRQWRYSPTLLNGEPVEVSTQISVQFALQQ